MSSPPVVLFGYDSSPFTNKVRLALRVKQIPFSYITVPSMLPRPLLTSTFALTYRKIPALLIGRSLYCDTSLIIEALEHHFPSTSGYGSVYPPFPALDSWSYKSLVRGFASFWTDKPLFRATTGLIPPSVWETRFGEDRSQLIGHQLSAKKLGDKRPENLARLDLHLSMLEPTFSEKGKWAIPTATPSLADISLYYQLRWGIDIAAGKGIYNLSGGGAADTFEDMTAQVWSEARYPGLWAWFHAFEAYIDSLPDLQETDPQGWIDTIKALPSPSSSQPQTDLLVPTAVEYQTEVQRDLKPGVNVSVAPDDTGRDNPQTGTLVAVGVEEVVLRPSGKADVDVLVHFPRLGFVVRAVEGARL